MRISAYLYLFHIARMQGLVLIRQGGGSPLCLLATLAAATEALVKIP